jgi:hypothetical protein
MIHNAKTQGLLIDMPLEFATRLALNSSWLNLMKETLPSMANEHHWPISIDHCFMRVCLDTALGAPWHALVRLPAIRHLTNDQMSKAIGVAQSIISSPELLHALNQNSIQARRLMRLNKAA